MKLIATTLAVFFSLQLQPVQAHAGREGVGGGNPASENCVNLGGTLEIARTPAGELGVCNIDGARIEEWTLFLSQGTETTQAAQALLNPAPKPGWTGGNPASVYCEASGGQSVIVEDTAGNQSGLCQFNDKSMIEEWTLFSGPTDPRSAKLIQILKN